MRCRAAIGQLFLIIRFWTARIFLLGFAILHA